MESARRSGARRLSAINRLSLVSSARYTSPIPPWPNRSPMRKRPTVTPDRDWGACAEFIGDGDSVIGTSRNSESDLEATLSGSHGELPTVGHLTPWLA